MSVDGSEGASSFESSSSDIEQVDSNFDRKEYNTYGVFSSAPVNDTFKRKRSTKHAHGRKKPVASKTASSLSASSSMGFAEFERHTKGIGSKLLAKMGYKPGEALGKNRAGIVEPVQVELLQKGVGLGFGNEYKEKKKDKHWQDIEAPVEDTASDEKPFIAKDKKFRKKTIQDILLEISSTQTTKIIDMTSAIPTERFLSSIQSTVESESISLFPEIDPNINALIATTQDQLTKVAQQLKLAEAKKAEYQRSLARVQESMAKFSNANKFDLLQLKALKETLDSNLESIFNAQTFQGIKNISRTTQINSFLYSLLYPLVKSLISQWTPFDTDERVYSLFSNLLLFVNSSEDLQLMTPYSQLFFSLIFPKLRLYVINDWNCRSSDALLEFLHKWQLLIPLFVKHSLIDSYILPKLEREVRDVWNPADDLIPVHTWIHTWFSLISPSSSPSSAFKSIFAIIRQKFSIQLQNWHPSNPSALAMLLPWKLLSTEFDLIPFLKKNILPKLSAVLEFDLVIDPSDQNVAPLEWIFCWLDLLPPKYFVQILVLYFFPKWYAVLYQWLTLPGADYEEISEWYVQWKNALPQNITEFDVIQKQFEKALDMMDQLLNDPSLPFENFIK